MPSICPRCGHPMNEELTETGIMGMKVKGCTHCGGFLADYSSTAEVIESTDIASKFAGNPEELSPEAYTPVNGACPICGGKFHPVPLNFELSNDVVYLDQCEGCNGIWFDKGELKKIFDLVFKESIELGSIEENIEDSENENAEFTCPRCNKHTGGSNGNIMDINVTKCKACEGIWVPGGQFEALGDITKIEVSDALNDLVKSVGEGAEAVSGVCPDCGSVLKKWENLPENIKDLYIDCCPNCHGLWFDKGEFTSFFRILNDSPFVQKEFLDAEPKFQGDVEEVPVEEVKEKKTVEDIEKSLKEIENIVEEVRKNIDEIKEDIKHLKAE